MNNGNKNKYITLLECFIIFVILFIACVALTSKGESVTDKLTTIEQMNKIDTDTFKH
jgi:hypothetical protein